MRNTNREWRGFLVPVFLCAQIVLAHAVAHSERPPAPPVLSRFPAEFGQWRRVREDPIAADVARELRADSLLSRTYAETSTGALASLMVAWFQSQSVGDRQPHSPKVCLPAAGWAPEVADEIALDTGAGVIAVNRYLAAKGTARAVVLYWYQTPRRAIAGEWAAKLWLVADALRDKRTDTALVRVISWRAGGSDAAAMSGAMRFAGGIYPLLRKELPP